ncbi:MAG TPA: helix-turn-helix transcriptional regulator [Candidatus Cloacimonadota bacterium]|nr:helix-turn-helix transcriptional regulator [Candidatus Cloacimonadota bacterium]
MDYQKLKELLVTKGITQREMCLEIGINEPSLSGIKNGTKKAGIEMILKISKYLNIHPSVIAPEYSDFFDFLSKNEDNLENNGSEFNNDVIIVNDIDNQKHLKYDQNMTNLINITNNLSFSNKELAISTKELALTTKEASSAMIEFARLIVQKEK